MNIYYAIWKENKHRFGEPIPYDYTFPIEFPNLVLRTKNLEEAKAKIEIINNKAKGIEPFDFKRKRVYNY
jgi:hypothetical protein